MLKKTIVLTSLLIPLSIAATVAPVRSQSNNSGGGAQGSPTFSSSYGNPSSYSYGTNPNLVNPVSNATFSGGGNSSGTQYPINGNQVLGAYGVGQQLLNGNFAGAASQLPTLLNSFGIQLSPQLSNIAGITPGVINNLLSGNLGGVVSQLPSILSAAGVQMSSQLSGIIGAAVPVLQSLLSGNFSLGTLVNAIASFLGFGGGNSAINWGQITQGLLTNGATASITGATFGTINNPVSQSQGQQTPNTNSVLAQTGMASCIHNPSCLASNPMPYRNLYTSTSGAMGYSDPVEMTGNIWRLSRQGIMSDAFSDDITQNSVYNSNHSTREITTARANEIVSKDGQQATFNSLQAAERTAQAVNQISEACQTNAKATFDVNMCNLKINTPASTYLAAIHSLGMKQREDNQFNLLLAANAGATADAKRRTEDVNQTALALAIGKTSFYEPKMGR